MPGARKKDSSIERAIAALERLASTPNAARLTMKERLAEPAMWAAIQKARMARHDTTAIAAVLRAEGISVKPNTLSVYIREIDREKKGEGDDGGLQDGKGKPRPGGAPARQGAVPANSPDRAGPAGGSGAGAGLSPPSAGRRLTRKPGMGGAFETHEL